MCSVLHVECLIPPALCEEGIILVLLRKILRPKDVSYSPRVTQHRNGRVWLSPVPQKPGKPGWFPASG